MTLFLIVAVSSNIVALSERFPARPHSHSCEVKFTCVLLCCAVQEAACCAVSPVLLLFTGNV